MANIITLKLDVKKLEKSRFFAGKPDKDGHEPLWCDLVLIPRKEIGRYGDTHFIKQSKKKDEEVDLPIIGNATERGHQQPQRAPAPAPRHARPQDDEPPF